MICFLLALARLVARPNSLADLGAREPAHWPGARARVRVRLGLARARNLAYKAPALAVNSHSARGERQRVVVKRRGWSFAPSGNGARERAESVRRATRALRRERGGRLAPFRH